MKKISLLFSILISFLIFANQPIIPQTGTGSYHKWWDDRWPGEQLNSPKAKALPQILVKGNKFVNEKGETILFRGLSIADPDKIEHQGHWSKALFEEVKKLGAMVVRIPIHPIAWRERTPEKYITLLDQAIEWCTEEGIYVDIDWHSIGNLEEELFQDPMYKTTKGETFNFWRTIAARYAGNNTVAFLELYNEPTAYSGKLGDVSWDQWKKTNESLIKLIRSYDNTGIPLVAGFDWAYDLTPVSLSPINAEGIAYVTHPYPHKRTPPYEAKWEEDFGFAAGKYPVIATEIGFTLGKESIEENGDYGKAIIKYLEAKGISWVWWVFDAEWTPHMFDEWGVFKLTDCGKFFKDAAHGEITK
jgi:endoglucanase